MGGGNICLFPILFQMPLILINFPLLLSLCVYNVPASSRWNVVHAASLLCDLWSICVCGGGKAGEGAMWRYIGGEMGGNFLSFFANNRRRRKEGKIRSCSSSQLCPAISYLLDSSLWSGGHTVTSRQSAPSKAPSQKRRRTISPISVPFPMLTTTQSARPGHYPVGSQT